MDLISLGYRTDLALLALGGTQIEDRGDHLVVRSPQNPTFWWGNFLLLDHMPRPDTAQWWLDRFSAAFPEARHVALGFDTIEGSLPELGWFVDHGFGAEASTVMTATKVHEPTNLATQAQCRRLRSDDDWRQSALLALRCSEPAVETPEHHGFVAARALTYRGLVDAGHGGWFGAFVEGRLAAQMGLFAGATGLARFQQVETDPDYRRQGLASSLLYHASIYGFDQLHAHTLVMVADPDYFAINLYRALGFVATETQLQIERPPSALTTTTGSG